MQPLVTSPESQCNCWFLETSHLTSIVRSELEISEKTDNKEMTKTKRNRAFSIFQLQAQLARKNTDKELVETKTELKMKVNIRQRFIEEQKYSK